MNSKKGGIGETVDMFAAVIAVIVILTVFVFISGVVRVVEKSESGMKIYNESQVGLENVFSYMWNNYHKLIETRVSVFGGNSIEDSLVRSGYYDE